MLQSLISAINEAKSNVSTISARATTDIEKRQLDAVASILAGIFTVRFPYLLSPAFLIYLSLIHRTSPVFWVAFRLLDSGSLLFSRALILR